jgi:alpha-tubulin suppressor-like RCC1 family protein
MNRPAPVPVSGLTDASAVGGGLSHTCAARRGGGLRCWGANLRGQLGDGTTTDRPAPVDVPTITDAARVTGGSDFTCVTRATGGLLCWGGNSNGQLGRGTQSARESTPASPMGW